MSFRILKYNSRAVDLDEQKSSPWDDVMCDSIHPDDLSVIRGRYESWKLAAKLDKYERVSVIVIMGRHVKKAKFFIPV